jgi:hypothetical protein
MKKFLLVAILLLVSCAPQLAQAPRDAVLYSANLAELKTYLINEMSSQSGGEGYGKWEWDVTTPSTTRFVAKAEYGPVDYVLTIFTLFIYSRPSLDLTVQIVGDNGKVSVLASPSYALVFDLLDKKFSRAP